MTRHNSPPGSGTDAVGSTASAPADDVAGPAEHRAIPGFPGYRLAGDRSVWSVVDQAGTLRPLKAYATSAGRLYVLLRRDGRNHFLFVDDLVEHVFPELAAGVRGARPAVEYRPLPGWPGYRVGADRSVWIELARPGLPSPWDCPRWHRLKTHSKNGGGAFVSLRWEGRECVRSIELLLRAAFAPASHQPGWVRRIGPPTPPPAAAVPPADDERAAVAGDAVVAELPAIAAAEVPAPPVEFRSIPGFPAYRLGSDDSLLSRRKRAGEFYPEPVYQTAEGRPFAWLKARARPCRLTIEELARATFPERPWPPEDGRDPAVEYLPLPGFPRYLVGSDKSVWAPVESTGRKHLGLPQLWRRRIVLRRPGARPAVVLSLNGRQVTRPLAAVIREAFACTLPRGPAHAETSARGSAHGRARLDEAKVAEARRLHADGWTLEQLSARFGVAPHTLGYAVRGITWRHVVPLSGAGARP